MTVYRGLVTKVLMVFRFRRLGLWLWGRVLKRLRSLGRSVRNQAVKVLVNPYIFGPRLRDFQRANGLRELPVFLIVCFKYKTHGSKVWQSPDQHVFVGPLKSANIADVFEYNLDVDASGGLANDNNLINLICTIKPDLIILTSYDIDSAISPNQSVLRTVRKLTDIPIVLFWPDTNDPEAPEILTKISEWVDLNVLLDSDALSKQISPRCALLRLWAPLDFNVFYPHVGEKDIPVSFLGSVGGYREGRKEYLDYLSSKGVNLKFSGGNEDPLALGQYADIMRRSKISLNFSHSINDTHQLKGRVFETMFSRSLLLENVNGETSKYFDPMVDYVVFENKEDLEQKIAYYLSHEEELKAITDRGYQKATRQYNHQLFWSEVTGKLQKLHLLNERR